MFRRNSILLKIKDKHGKVKFVLRDDDDEPISIDELILKDNKQRNSKRNGEEDADSNKD